MKKLLLLSTAAAVSLSSIAAGRAIQRPAAPACEKLQVERVTEPVKAQQATQWAAPMVKAPAKTVQYKRPQGSFYGVGHLLENGDYTGSYYTSCLLVRPYAEQTFANVSSLSGTPKWTFQMYEDGTRQEFTSSDFDLTVQYGYEFEPSVPILSYANLFDFGKSYYRTTDVGESGVFPIYLCAVANLVDSYGGGMPVSSKFMGYCVRQGTGNYGYTYYSGAGEDTDGDGYGNGNWFGSGSPYDAIATRFEAPLQPYAINGAYIQCQGYTAEDVELPVKVYEVLEEGGLQEVYDEETGEMVNRNVPATLGELIAEGKFTITASAEEDGDAYILYAPFVVEGTDFEWTPEITTSIMVVVEGINDTRLSNFTFLIGSDTYDEGWGSLGYLGYSISDETGEPALYSLTNFFTSATLQTAPTVWLDVTMPWIMPYYTFIPDSYEAPVEGGEVEFHYSYTDESGATQTLDTPLSLYSYEPSDGVWDITLADGSDLPDWIEIETSDVNTTDDDGNEVFANQVDVYITVAALPEGTAGRKATIKFWYPGASYLFTVTQGEVESGEAGDTNGDGQVDAADIAYLIGDMLGNTASDFNAGNADLNGDGQIDAADIAALIAKMFGE